MTNLKREYSGLIPAIPVPFTNDMQIDEPSLRRLSKHLVKTKAVAGLLTNGHTGEVFALNAVERATVTRIVAEEVSKHSDLPVISAVACEGINDAVLHGVMAKDAGARALMIMPPHHWLRFGYRRSNVLDLFDAVAQATALDIFVHVYPAWTKASYPSELLGALSSRPYIKVFKLGTRDMNQYARDIAAIRAADPTTAILTCHDEYLLPTMVHGIDGALVGFGSFIPETINNLWNAVQRGDLHEAQKLQAFINPLKESIYGSGEPTGDAHSRLKYAMKLAGLLENSTPRPPTTEPEEHEKERIRKAVETAGLAKTVIAHA